MTDAFNTEAELAVQVIAWLTAEGWDVYQEVDGARGVADIVATLGPITWVIECKLGLALAVLEQAWRWTGHAHRASVAVPAPRKPRTGDELARRIARSLGVGIIRVAAREHVPTVVREEVPAALHRRITRGFTLHPEQRSFSAAGSSGAPRWTDFRRTAEAVRSMVRAHPGVTLAELLAETPTHYRKESTARRCLVHWIERGVIEGIRVDREAGRARLFPAEAAAS